MAKILNALRGKERSLKKGEEKDDRREDDDEFCVSTEITFSIGAAVAGKEVKEADAAASEGISFPTAANASKARDRKREKARSWSQLSLNRFSTNKI
jgi:hypothetical protein